MRILYIHGANCTHNSFNYLRLAQTQHKADYFDYTAEVPALTNLARLVNKLDEIDDNTFVVAHSLGGLLAVLAAEQRPDKIKSIVSLSSPYGGCGAASVLGMWFRHQLFSDVCPSSELIRRVRNAKVTCPITAVISTAGATPFMREANDGVVTLASQRALMVAHAQLHLDYNHSEILQSVEVAELITTNFFGV